MAYRSVTITLLGLAGAALLARNGDAASFNCDAAATPTEKAICGNGQLSSLDDQTSGMYFTIIGASLPAATLSAVKSAQAKFLNKRDSCGADFNCLVDAYTSQIGYLKQTEEQLLPSADNWASFASPTFGFSIRYPRGYSVDPAYRYEALGPGKEISGVSFTIPEAMTKGTNLSDDTYVSVETLPDAASCTASPFLDTEKVRDVKEGNTEYSVAQHDEGPRATSTRSTFTLLSALRLVSLSATSSTPATWGCTIPAPCAPSTSLRCSASSTRSASRWSSAGKRDASNSRTGTGLARSGSHPAKEDSALSERGGLVVANDFTAFSVAIPSTEA